MFCPSAVIDPVVVVSVFVPPALPTALTGWPSFTVDDVPVVTVARPDAPFSWRTATSAARS